MNHPAPSFFQRLLHMAAGWGSICVVYMLTLSKDQAAAFMLQPSFIDRWFVFDPDAIWLYLSFFLLVPAGYFLCAANRLRWLTLAMQISALGAALVFVLWPTTMVFPEVTQTGFSASTLLLLMHHDSLHNCLPSLHVTLTVLAVWALWERKRPLRSTAFALWGVAITVSILQLHRHQFIDLACGALLAVCAGWMARVLVTARSRTATETV